MVTKSNDSLGMGYPISGFPRALFQDDTRSRMIRPALGGNCSTRRRTASTQLRREKDKWEPKMAESVSRTMDPIAGFSSPGYHVGGASPQDLAEMESLFTRPSLRLRTDLVFELGASPTSPFELSASPVPRASPRGSPGWRD